MLSSLSLRSNSPSRIGEALRLFRTQQDSARNVAGIRRVAEDLTGIVDSDGIRDREAGVRRNQRIEVNQRAVTVDEADVFARSKRMIALNGKDGDTDNLSGAVDPSRLGSRSSRKRSQVSPAAFAMEARVRGMAVNEKVAGYHIASAIDRIRPGTIRAGGYAERDHFSVGVEKSSRCRAITHDLAGIIDRRG